MYNVNCGGAESRRLSGPNNNDNTNNDNKHHNANNNNKNNNKSKHHSLLSKNDPRTVQLKTHHTLDADFQERVNVLRSELTDSELTAINAFSKTLRESHCRRDDGTRAESRNRTARLCDSQPKASRGLDLYVRSSTRYSRAM
jgi:hypothetical protein